MAKPLNELKEKKEWKWDDEHQKAFKIISQLVLALPKRKEKFRVETDASEYAIEEVLS